MVPIEMFIMVIIAGIIIFSLLKGLVFVAVLILAVGIAYYTGMAGAFIELISGLLPVATEDPEVAMTIVSTLLLA